MVDRLRESLHLHWSFGEFRGASGRLGVFWGCWMMLGIAYFLTGLWIFSHHLHFCPWNCVSGSLLV